jgi:hypothetical protein
LEQREWVARLRLIIPDMSPITEIGAEHGIYLVQEASKI